MIRQKIHGVDGAGGGERNGIEGIVVGIVGKLGNGGKVALGTFGKVGSGGIAPGIGKDG